MRVRRVAISSLVLSLTTQIALIAVDFLSPDSNIKEEHATLFLGLNGSARVVKVILDIAMFSLFAILLSKFVQMKREKLEASA